MLFSEWCDRNMQLDSEKPLTNEVAFQCISSAPIHPPCPRQFNPPRQARKRSFLYALSHPPTSLQHACEHGHHFNQNDPVANGQDSRSRDLQGIKRCAADGLLSPNNSELAPATVGKSTMVRTIFSSILIGRTYSTKALFLLHAFI